MLPAPMSKQIQKEALQFCEDLSAAFLDKKDYQAAINKLEEWHIRRMRMAMRALFAQDGDMFKRLHSEFLEVIGE